MKRTAMCTVLLVLFLERAAPGWAASHATHVATIAAAPRFQGGTVSNSFGSPADAYMEFTLSGGDLQLREGTAASYEGSWSGGPITLSGKMIVDRSNGMKSWVTMSANVADQSFAWPPEWEDNAVMDRAVSQSFNLTFDVPPDYDGGAITGGARLEVCGGVCGVYAMDFWIEMPDRTATTEPATEPPSEPTQPIPSPTPEPQYRLSIVSTGPRNPLQLTLRLEKQESPGADAAFTRVPNAQLQVAALAYQGNETRLADEFLAASCQNCEWRDAGGDRLAHLAAPDQPLLLQTDAHGEAALGLFLDFAKLGGRAPLGGTPLNVPIAAEYWAEDGKGTSNLQARAEQTISLDAIAVVTAITYEEAQLYDKFGNLMARDQGPLSSYLDDPGTKDGPHTLAGSDRVLLARYGQDYMGAPGQTLGTALAEGDLLRVGDQITINACDMVTNRIENGLPAGAPGVIWVKVRFFDGLRAKVGVNGSVCRSSVRFGESPAASGWLGSGEKFFYWSVNGAANAVIGHYFWPYKLLSGLSSAGKTLAWLLGNEAAGWDPVYIKVKSALWIEFDQAGVMHVTTREGEPEVFTAATGEEGVPVPVGKTASVTGAGEVSLADTDSATAGHADELLDELDPLVEETGWDPAGAADDLSASSGAVSLKSLALPFFGCGGLILILLLGGLVVVIKRSKRDSSRHAENDWMEDLPTATGAGTLPGQGSEPIWELVVEQGPDAGKRFPLSGQMRLGRSSENGVHLADPQASRQHAAIQRIGGNWIISDLGSSNGTFVGSSRLVEPTRLREGDAIRIGNTTLKLVAGSVAPGSGRVPPSNAARETAPGPRGTAYCPNCGHALTARTRFCPSCGAPLDGAGAAPPAPGRPAPVQATAEPDSSVVGVISFVERRKGLMRKEAFNLVLTPDRLVFARLTSEMLKAATEQARQAAKDQGKGFFGQWGAQLGASGTIADRYYQMPVEAILREHPDNWQILVHQVRKVQFKHGQYDEDMTNPDQMIIHAGDKIKLELKGVNLGDARKMMRQVLGDRAK